MGEVTTLGGFLDGLVLALSARAGLDGVNVYSARVSPEDEGEEAVIIGDEAIELTFDRLTAPKHQVFESYEVPCRVLIQKSGGGETTIKAARDRALAILEEVVDELDSSATDSITAYAALGVRKARVTGGRLRQGVEPASGERVCAVEFSVEVAAEFLPA